MTIRHRASWFAGLVIVALAAPPVRVRAQAPNSDDARLFREGREALKRKQWLVACERFSASLALKVSPGTLLNQAECRDKLGRLVEAQQSLRAAIELLASDDPHHQRKPGEEHLAALEARVPRLTITLAPGAPDGTKVLLDDRGVEPNNELRRNPGKHVIVVRAPGYAERGENVTLREGELTEVSVAPGEKRPDPSAGPVAGRERPSAVGSRDRAGDSSTKVTWGLVSLGVGAAGFIGVVVMENRLASDCDGPHDTCPATYDLNGNRTLDGVFLGLGLVGTGLGAYLLLSGDDQGATALAPTVGRHHGMLTATGRF